MHLSKIILWPKTAIDKCKIIQLEKGKVNFIIGDYDNSRSCIWQIIDYCLASSELRVPIGMARELVSWYGIMLSGTEKSMLICRRNATVEGSAKDFMLLQGSTIEIPLMPETNTNIGRIKNIFSKNFNVFIKSVEGIIRDEFKDPKVGVYSYRDLLILNNQLPHALINPTTFISDTNNIKVLKLRKLLPVMLYPKGKGYYKVKKRMRDKVDTKMKVISERITHLKTRMISLYNLAHRHDLVSDYIPPEADMQRTTETYRRLLNEIIEQNHHLLSIAGSADSSIVTQSTIEQIKTISRIQECLEFSDIIITARKLQDNIEYLGGELNKMVHDANQKGENEISQFSALIQLYAESMKINSEDFVPVFDDKEGLLKFRNVNGEEFFLYQLGDIKSFIGYNIALFLAFQEKFINQGYNFVLPFLILDRPSGSFVAEKELVGDKRLDALYRTLDLAVERLKERLQIIVLEPDSLDQHSGKYRHIAANWSDQVEESLIPKHWQ